MSIPRAVQAQAERADALLAGLQTATPQPPATPPAPATPPTPPAPAAPTPPVAPTGSAPVPPVGAPVDQGLEHRYQVLQGKYNAEVPRLHAEVARLTQEVENRDRLIAQLQATIEKLPKPSAVSPQEIEEHGEGLVDMVRRLAKEQTEELAGQLAAAKAEIESLRSGVGVQRQKSFLETLAEKVPDWAVINDDSQFHNWLGEIDVLSGQRRQQLLEDAHTAQDGARAAAIFTAFKKDRDSWAANALQALQHQVVPSGSGGGGPPPPDPSQGRIWTRAEIDGVYRDIRRGVLKGERAAAAEAEIQLAMQERRVR